MAKKSSKSGGNLHQWFSQSKSEDGKRGWVNVVTGGTCASDEPGEGVPKCVSSEKRASMTKQERLSASRRKKEKDPNQQEKTGAAKPTYVSTDKPKKETVSESDIKKKNSGKKDACYHKVKSRYRVWPSAYASGALVKCREKGAKNWGNSSKINENHKQIESGKEKDDEGYMANIELQSIEKSVAKLKNVIKKKDQQLPAWVQSKITRATDYINTAADYLESDDELKESRRNPLKDPSTQIRRSTGVGALTPKAAEQSGPKAQELQKREAAKVNLPKFNKEDVSLVDQILREMGCDCHMKPHKSPEEIAKKHKVPLSSIQKQLKMGIKVESEHTNDKNEAESIALQHLDELPNYYSKLKKVEKKPVSEASTLPRQTGNILSVVLSWRGKTIMTQVFFPSLKFPTRSEIQYEMEKIYPDSRVVTYKIVDLRQDQPLIQISNSKSKNYLLNNKTIGEGFEYHILNEFKTAAWQRSEGKNPEGGLNKKGIAAYRRENPGSKLSMAVTTPPSKLKPGSKRAKRRKSFCARMSGMKGPMRKNGKPTRKALALKKWNC